MTPNELKQWMDEHFFDTLELATALGANRVTISRWRTGERTISQIAKLALDHIAEDRKALRERKRRRERITKAREGLASAHTH